MVINFLFLMIVLYRKIDGFSLRTLGAGLTKIVSAASLMSLVLIFLYRQFHHQFYLSILHQLTFLFLLIAVSSLCYITVLHLLGLQELRDITAKIKAGIAR